MPHPTLRDQFLLRPDITYLNFGSFGACPRPIFERYQQFQLELEQEPVQFITQNGLQYIRESKQALGEFLNADADDLILVTNPSYGVNIVAKSLDLKAGDEVLTTQWEYGACDRTWQYYCDKSGARYIKHPIRLPLESEEDFVAQFLTGITPKTKLIFISHITSSTAIRFPVEKIVAVAKERGIMTFVDGAHAPAQVSLNLRALDADIYTGACHKWMMTPKGSSFLLVRKELQDLFDPLVISWGYKSDHPFHSRYQDYHQQQGTRDFSAFCCIPAAINFMKEHQWDSISTQCRKIVLDNALRFCDLLATKPLVPLNDFFVRQMFSIPIKTQEPEKLKARLFDEFKIEIPVMRTGEHVFLRYSIQAFNTQEDLDRLEEVLIAIR
ncbi:MAG: aminotransferase class V-fold PLP-dependent enzyme [Bacteroidetes bacterium]|nr:aminotransferase class V-fold PLP-dependent enzyme [Bacteroidota bacterium]